MKALEKIISDIIAGAGDAISLAVYMELALQHPEHGYYRVRDPVGRKGDFVTAPEVSQMFGEMIGVWCVEVWRSLGKPDPFVLAELGPGNGTMMQDLLRATVNAGTFHAAKKLCLIDSNAMLRQKQQEKLADYKSEYFDDIASMPRLPCLILANEFFDALAVRQFEKTFQGWGERMVTIANDSLAFTLRLLEDAEIPLIPPAMRDALPGTVFEFSPRAQHIMRDLCRHLAAHQGAMLIVDYGYVAPSGTPTVQAVSNHEYANILERPGEVDLTAHVDLTGLATIARDLGLQAAPITGQGVFLKNMGIKIRAETLKKHATSAQINTIDKALDRLIGFDQMGDLFKVLEVRT